MCTQQTIDKLFSSQHLHLQYLSATSLEMIAVVLLGQKLIIITIIIIIIIHFYSAISQWSKDALQKFMKKLK